MEEKPVPTGVVTGPFSATLLARMESSTSCGSGSPKRLIASAPTKYLSHSMSTPAHSMMETTAAVTSGPMPSPGRSVILCLAIAVNPFQSLARALEIEVHGQQRPERREIGQLAEAAPHALQRRRDEVEVMQLPPLDGLAGEGAEDLGGALGERLAVGAGGVRAGTARTGVFRAAAAVVLHQLHLRLVPQDAADAAVAQEGGEVVRRRPHSHVLIIDQKKLIIYDMNILAVIIAVR